MKTLKKLFLPLIAFLTIGNTVQAQCNPSNSPTFQATTSMVFPAINGFCHMQINIENANTTPAGGPVSFCIMAPGQSTCTQPPAIVTAAGIWTVTVKDNSNNCATSQTVQVNSLPAPNVAVVAGNTLVCSGYMTTLTASGANTYTWNTSATTASILITPATTTTYSVTGTGNNGCATTATVVVNVSPLPSITITANQNPVCANEPVTLTASGANTFTWNTLQTGAGISITPGATTIYTVYGANEYGCESFDQIFVTVSACTPSEELKNEKSSIVLYPNPAQDALTLSIALEHYFEEVLIYNDFGQLIRTEKLVLEHDKAVIKTSDLSNGVYLLELKDFEKVLRKRFAVNR